MCIPVYFCPINDVFYERATRYFYSIPVKALEDEEKMTPEQLAIKNVGKLDPKRHLEEKVCTFTNARIYSRFFSVCISF
jgi:hypothetical protein